jgi:hypothetical protein
MILAPLFGVALVVTVSTEPLTAPLGPVRLSTQQKNSAMEPLVRSATDCIVHAVTADPRFETASAAAIGDMIVNSMPNCVRPVRAMIDSYDRYFGDGTGEAFFMGPYLDVLPKAVSESVHKAAISKGATSKAGE